MNDIPACAHSPGRWKRQDRQFVCLDCGTTMVDPITALMLAGLLTQAQAEIDQLKQERDALKQCAPVKILCDALKEAKQFREALSFISKMGRVCPDFETCHHPACSDSCGACLTAINVLSTPLPCPMCSHSKHEPTACKELVNGTHWCFCGVVLTPEKK